MPSPVYAGSRIARGNPTKKGRSRRERQSVGALKKTDLDWLWSGWRGKSQKTDAQLAASSASDFTTTDRVCRSRS